MGQQRPRVTRGGTTRVASSAFQAGATTYFSSQPSSSTQSRGRHSCRASAKHREPAGASLAVLQTFIAILAALRPQSDSKFHHRRYITVIQSLPRPLQIQSPAMLCSRPCRLLTCHAARVYDRIQSTFQLSLLPLSQHLSPQLAQQVPRRSRKRNAGSTPPNLHASRQD